MPIAIVSPATRNVSIFVVVSRPSALPAPCGPRSSGRCLVRGREFRFGRPVDRRRAPPIRLGDGERRWNGDRQLVQGPSHDDDRHGFCSRNDHTGLRRNRSSADGRASGIGRAAGSGDGVLAVLTSDRSWNVCSDVGDARSGLRHWKDIGGARSRAVRWGRHSDVGLVRDGAQAPTRIAEGPRGRLPDTDAVGLQGEGLAGTRKSSGVPDGTLSRRRNSSRFASFSLSLRNFSFAISCRPMFLATMSARNPHTRYRSQYRSGRRCIWTATRPFLWSAVCSISGCRQVRRWHFSFRGAPSASGAFLRSPRSCACRL